MFAKIALPVMKIAVMQPYLLPYIGYWELVAAADVFVVLDDVQFIRRGWINRNRIRNDRKGEGWSYLTVPTGYAPLETRILDIQMRFQSGWDRSMARRLENLYGDRPSKCSIANTLVSLPSRSNRSLLLALFELLQEVCGILEIPTRIVLASDIDPSSSASAQRRIIDLVVRLGGREYLNLPRGRGLYDAGAFAEAGVRLRILPETNFSSWAPASSRLSILDGILAGGLDRIRAHLHGFHD